METGYLSLNVAYLDVEHALIQRLAMPLYDETTAVDVRHAVPADVAQDAAVGLRLWNNLAVGIGATYYRTRSRVDVTGTVPHPLFYAQPREVEFQPGGFSHTEVGIHLHAAWVVRMADRVDIALSAGPSLFLAEYDRVSELDVREVGAPYDEVHVDVIRDSVQKRVPGANVGIDLTYHLIRSLEPGALFWTAGVGIFVRWTTGTSALPEFGPDETLEVGGLQAGAGLRFRF